MSRDSEVTSKHTSSIRMGSNDNLSSPRLKYSSDNLSVSDRSSSSESSLGKLAH